MRTYLFRGKRVENGEWIYGYFVKVPPRVETHGTAAVAIQNLRIPYILDDDGMMAEVIPESVGQWTGLEDKNCVKVFERDVVDAEGYKPRRMEVKFVEGGFCCDWGDANFPIDINHFYPSNGCCFEVIGNITDNPELLK